MYCSQYRDVIQELVDGTLGPVRRAELQTHLDHCDDCRALVADLQKIRATAASLDRPQPPDHVWMQIAGRLRQEGRVSGASSVPRRNLAWLALAAALVIAVGGSIYVLLPLRSQQATSGNAAAGTTVQSAADEMQIADQHMQLAIEGMRRAVDMNDGTLDAETRAVIEKNLQVLDGAISESRAALKSDPQNAPARASLFDALRQKVTLLQDTIALMNELRKGNSAGAAQIIDGAKKS